MWMNWDEMREMPNASADQDLGTIVSVLDGQGLVDDASPLELCRLVDAVEAA